MIGKRLKELDGGVESLPLIDSFGDFGNKLDGLEDVDQVIDLPLVEVEEGGNLVEIELLERVFGEELDDLGGEFSDIPLVLDSDSLVPNVLLLFDFEDVEVGEEFRVLTNGLFELGRREVEDFGLLQEDAVFLLHEFL